MKPLSKSIACIQTDSCVACGCCLKVCPRQALTIWKGSYAAVDENLCVGCGKCARECPASVIEIIPRNQENANPGASNHTSHSAANRSAINHSIDQKEKGDSHNEL